MSDKVKETDKVVATITDEMAEKIKEKLSADGVSGYDLFMSTMMLVTNPSEWEEEMESVIVETRLPKGIAMILDSTKMPDEVKPQMANFVSLMVLNAITHYVTSTSPDKVDAIINAVKDVKNATTVAADNITRH